LQFHQSLTLSPSLITIEKVQGLQQTLRNNIESILNLGVLLNSESNEILLVNTTHNMNKKSEEEKHLLFPQEFDHAMISPTKALTKPSPASSQRHRFSSFNDEAFNPPNDLQYNLYLYNKEFESHPIFIKNMAMAMEFIGNLSAAHFDNPHMVQMLKKIQYNIEMAVLQHERLKAVSSVKELDLNLQRSYIRLLFENTRRLEDFIIIRNRNVNSFFESVMKKIETAKGIVTGIVDNGDVGTSPQAKAIWLGLNNLRRVFRDLEGMINNILKSNQGSNAVDIRGIEEEFKVKFKIIYDQWIYFSEATKKAIEHE
jgi:hypothetical protein